MSSRHPQQRIQSSGQSRAVQEGRSPQIGGSKVVSHPCIDQSLEHCRNVTSRFHIGSLGMCRCWLHHNPEEVHQVVYSPDSLRWLKYCLVAQEKHLLYSASDSQIANKPLQPPRQSTCNIGCHRDTSRSPPLMLSSKTLHVPRGNIPLLWTPIGAMKSCQSSL